MGNARQRQTPVGVLLAILVAGFLVAGCGDDEPEEAPAQLMGPTAEFRGGTAPLAGGSFELLTEIRGSSSPEGTSLIVGHLLFEDPADAAGTKLRLTIGNEPAAAAEQSVVRSGGSAAAVIACLCEMPRDAGRVSLEARGSGEIDVGGRSLIMLDNVEAPPSRGEHDLPAPLLAASVEGGETRIDAGSGPLLEASLPSALPAATPVLVLGAIEAATTDSDLESIQVDAVIGGERVQPRGDFARPTKYVGIYSGESGGGEPIELLAGTADGSTPIEQRALFACACTVTTEE